MPSVMTIVTGAPLRITEATLEDGKLVIGKTIEVSKYKSQQPPLWMAPQGLHSAENVGSVTFHAYLVELKDLKGSSSYLLLHSGLKPGISRTENGAAR